MSDLKNVPFAPAVLPAPGIRICGAAPTGCMTSAKADVAARKKKRERMDFMRPPGGGPQRRMCQMTHMHLPIAIVAAIFILDIVLSWKDLAADWFADKTGSLDSLRSLGM